jgi:hypothetical protein
MPWLRATGRGFLSKVDGLGSGTIRNLYLWGVCAYLLVGSGLLARPGGWPMEELSRLKQGRHDPGDLGRRSRLALKTQA